MKDHAVGIDNKNMFQRISETWTSLVNSQDFKKDDDNKDYDKTSRLHVIDLKK